jgi:hypothetical protein
MDDLPTEFHREAVRMILTELQGVEHQLLVAGSVAQQQATPDSDVDLLVLLQSQAACGGVASLAIGRVIDAAALHEIVAVTRYFAGGVKVSMRVLRMSVVETFFDAGIRGSIWKTHSVHHQRVEPEFLITPDGEVLAEPFDESRSHGGYAYPLKTHSLTGRPVLNVESTMLLTSKSIQHSGRSIDAPELIGRAVLADVGNRSGLIGRLVRARYLDEKRGPLLEIL